MGLDFLILYEHVVREYESITLLKLELERRGYTAEIRQLLDRKKLKYFTWKKPKVLVASAMYDNKQPVVLWIDALHLVKIDRQGILDTLHFIYVWQMNIL